MTGGTFPKFLFFGVIIAIALFSGAEVRRIAQSPPSSENVPILFSSARADISGASVVANLAAPVLEKSAPTAKELSAALSAVAVSENKIFYPISAEAPPALEAQAALVADMQTGEVYFDLNSGKRWPTASIVKLMTAAYAMRNMDPNSEIILSVGDFPLDAGDAFKVFQPGDTYRLKDLLQALLVSSSNEAAEAIANFYGRKEFIAGLSALAEEWGMASAYFADPTGLSVTDQASARDMRIMAKKIYEAYPGILKTTRQKSVAITEIGSGRRKMLANINLFAGQPWFLGGKTGYTDEANGNLLTLISHGGRPVVVIVLGTADRFGETEKLVNWFRRNYRLNS